MTTTNSTSVLEHQRVLVTGGTRGIGEALCIALRTAGARVLACGSSSVGVERFLAAHPGMEAVVCDVARPVAGDDLAAHIQAKLGGLDVVIHCAGVQSDMALTGGAPSSGIEREVAINLLAPMRITQALLPRLLESRRAAIVNVTSVLALTPKRSAPVYCATKAGLASWTTGLRYQLEPHGVHVMELVPPLVATAMTRGRDQGAVEPDVVASACIEGLARRLSVVRVDKAKLAYALHRFAPGALASKMRDA